MNSGLSANFTGILYDPGPGVLITFFGSLAWLPNLKIILLLTQI